MAEPIVNALELGPQFADIHPPEVVVYWDDDFQGESWRTNLAYSSVGDHWNDKISSIIVIAGIWEFWEDNDFGGHVCTLGPGYYGRVHTACEGSGLSSFNDKISSFRPIAWS